MKNITLAMILGGIFGLITNYIFAILTDKSFLFGYSFHFVLFTGLLLIIAIQFDFEIPLLRTVVVGAVSGITYYLLANNYPIISVAILSFVIGFGFRKHKDKYYGVILNTLKASIFIPFGIVIISLLDSFMLNTYMIWFMWGSMLTMTLVISLVPMKTICASGEHYIINGYRHSEIVNLQRESRDIINELSEIMK